MSPRALYRKINYGFSSNFHMLVQWTSQLARMSVKCEIPSSNPRWGKVFFLFLFWFPQPQDQPPYTLGDNLSYIKPPTRSLMFQKKGLLYPSLHL